MQLRRAEEVYKEGHFLSEVNLQGINVGLRRQRQHWAIKVNFQARSIWLLFWCLAKGAQLGNGGGTIIMSLSSWVPMLPSL